MVYLMNYIPKTNHRILALIYIWLLFFLKKLIYFYLAVPSDDADKRWVSLFDQHKSYTNPKWPFNFPLSSNDGTWDNYRKPTVNALLNIYNHSITI